MGYDFTVLLFVLAICNYYQEIYGIKKNRHVKDNSEEINNYIWRDIKFDKDQVLVYKGESKDSVPVKKEGKIDENKCFIVITREKKTVQNGKCDIGVVSLNEHTTYPGALMLADEQLVNNRPTKIPLDQANLTYVINLPGLTKEGHFNIKPTFAEYEAALQKALKTWFDEYPKDHYVAANFQSDSCCAYSMSYLAVKLGIEFLNTQCIVKSDIEAMYNQEKTIVVYKFRAIFYTVCVDPVMKPSDLFGPSVTVEDLKRCTDSSKPPVIVSCVSYGIDIFLKLESLRTSSEAKTILETKATTLDLSEVNDLEVNKTLKDVKIQLVVRGGNSGLIKLNSIKSLSEAKQILAKYSAFSRENLGVPVCYTTQFLTDNSMATMQMATDYIETTKTVYCKGVIKLIHHGWFVMQFAVTWKEVSYDKNGDKVEKEVCWEKNWKDLTAPFEAEIEIPGNAVNIRVYGRECTGLFWEWWRTVIDKHITLQKCVTIKVTGTTLIPKCEIKEEK